MREPGPDHPITIEPHAGRVVVRSGGVTVADTRRALRMQEASYPAVYYVPRADADLARLERSSRTSYCPYKGEASYYSVVTEAGRAADAVWSYEEPYPAMRAIAGHLAFYPDKVEITAG